MSIEAIKNALEALGPNAPECCGCKAEWEIAITALRQAIAEAEKQEPVKWQDTRKTWVDVPLKNVLKEKSEWIGLTEAEF